MPVSTVIYLPMPEPVSVLSPWRAQPGDVREYIESRRHDLSRTPDSAISRDFRANEPRSIALHLIEIPGA